ncbi:hypothetical protein [Microbacterium esteraromaticum]|uniref:hypothetical protein n=1 Tax=Microbacterium esteraromaticum TaxID=57043 RepID=UPI001C97403E|nr:hypothetical protein [Microbacterium esteraromaticum]MBY6062066.1 hypothetical protein [Microbacterium esteraromaticum]
MANAVSGKSPVAGIGAAVVAVLLLAACTSPPPSADERAEDSVGSTPDASEAPVLTGTDIGDWIRDTEWSFAGRGIEEPFTIAFKDGQASDDHMRTYEIGVGVGVESDANGDGIVDLAVPVSQLDGNGFQELWYIWLGNADDVEPVARQVIYPIARTTRCGDVVQSVNATEDGFTIDQMLWMPHTDQDRDCADGGSGHQTREVTVIDVDGVAFPMQTSPVEAWGGVCPRSDWLDGILDDTITARAAPPASAPQVISPGELVGLYELAPAPLLTSDGVRFFGFQADATSTTTDGDQVRMHCAFG